MAQLCGNDPDIIVQVGRNLQEYNGFCQCDARSIGRGELKKKKLYMSHMTDLNLIFFFFKKSTANTSVPVVTHQDLFLSQLKVGKHNTQAGVPGGPS